MSILQRHFFLCSLACALFAGLLFWHGRGGGFLLDDKPTISDNSAVQVSSLNADSLTQAASGYQAGGGTRPLPMLSFAVDYSRSGLDPAAFKSTNIAIHVLTTLVLAFFFRLLLRLAGFTPPYASCSALALALAWAIHPLQVSSVLYIVQRMQTMCTLFLILALWAYLRMRRGQLDGVRSRQFGILAGLFWVLALASKEDSILLPLYTLALELTALRFRAADPALSRKLRRYYLLAALAGTTFFLAIIVPHYWHRDAYPFRDFSSWERLLTQGRVLCMYLWEILLPLPSHMPFNYDWIQPSRGLLQPWTTLPALVLVFSLLFLAWRLRTRRPLFSLGVFLFFAGHFITSNAINLELAFEHRNHFPLIGAVLAIGDLLAAASARLQLRPRYAMAACALLLATLGGATALRVHAWGTPLGLAQYAVRVAPNSARAWMSLCQANYGQSGNDTKSSYFDAALAACSKGSELPNGASNLASLLVLKSIKGTIAPSDWAPLELRMRQDTITPSTMGVGWYLVRYSNHDERINPRNVVRIVNIISQRVGFRPDEYAGFGYYALRKGLQQDAFEYFSQAVRTSPPNSRLVAELIDDLKAQGRGEWANKLDAMARANRNQQRVK